MKSFNQFLKEDMFADISDEDFKKMLYKVGEKTKEKKIFFFVSNALRFIVE